MFGRLEKIKIEAMNKGKISQEIQFLKARFDKIQDKIDDVQLYLMNKEIDHKLFFNDKPEFEPLPEGIEFNHYKDSDYLWFKFGNRQMITYRDDVDYIVRERFPSLFEPNATSKCHLEPCKIEDLRLGDWFFWDNKILLLLTNKRWLYPSKDGTIRIDHPSISGSEGLEVKKIVYNP
jgi:hypothetical protein